MSNLKYMVAEISAEMALNKSRELLRIELERPEPMTEAVKALAQVTLDLESVCQRLKEVSDKQVVKLF